MMRKAWDEMIKIRSYERTGLGIRADMRIRYLRFRAMIDHLPPAKKFVYGAFAGGCISFFILFIFSIFVAIVAPTEVPTENTNGEYVAMTSANYAASVVSSVNHGGNSTAITAIVWDSYHELGSKLFFLLIALGFIMLFVNMRTLFNDMYG